MTPSTTLRRHTRRAVWLTCALALALPGLVLAHAVVYPKTSAPGAYERYVLRVPNEKAVPTTRVELRFPADVRVSSFSDVPGWQLEAATDSAGHITGATWTGTLAPQRFVELPFIAVNPRTDARLVWPVVQTYADGERVEWTEAEAGKRPASVTEIRAATVAPTSTGMTWPAYAALAALALSLVSLGLTLRRKA